MLKGSRLQPGDVLDTLRPTCVGHQPYAGAKGEPDRRTKNQMKQQELQEQKSPKRGAICPFILKGHVTQAHVAP